MQSVIFVCWGNICRSTMAEQVLRAEVDRAGLDVEVDSAGTSREELGSPLDPRAAATLRRTGYDPGDHVARQITAAEIAAADLVIAMEQLHVDRMAAIAGVDVDEPEFAAKVRLLTSYDPAAAAGLGVPDPWYGPDSAFDETLAQIEAAVPGILDSLRAGEDPTVGKP